MVVLEAKNITKDYNIGDEKLRVLKGVSLKINKGELVAILGPSGSGKSTLLHILGGVDYPTTGRVCINNVDITLLKEKELTIFRRKHIGVIYQFYNLIPILDVEENILLPLMLDNKKTDSHELEKIISLLGLQDRKRHLPGQLSGGQQQRVAIGRAIMAKPDIILADEPTGNLDRKNTMEIMRLFQTLCHTYQQTIVMITHDEILAKKCDLIYYILDGELIE